MLTEHNLESRMGNNVGFFLYLHHHLHSNVLVPYKKEDQYRYPNRKGHS